MTFVPTLSLLTALRTAITAIALPSSFSAVPDYPKAFTTVEIWGVVDLVKAIEEMRIFDDRFCLIVASNDHFDSAMKGSVLTSEQRTEIELLFADRNYGRENLALVGEQDVSPGVLVLKDLLLSNLAGANLGFNNVALAPTSGGPFTMSGKQQDALAFRECWNLSFTTSAGLIRKDTGR
jgi:hypothetical protein